MESSLRTEEREIGGLTVVSTTLPAMRAYTLLARLLKLAGPGMAIPGASWFQIIAGAVAGMETKELGSLLREIFEKTAVKRNDKLIPLNTDEGVNLVFTGQIGLMLRAVRFALELNFANFFDDGENGLASLFAGLGAEGTSP